MKQDPTPSKTPQARALLAGPRTAMAPALRMLLISVDGRRPLGELQRIARSLGLGDEALEGLRREGLVSLAPERPTEPAPSGGDALRRLVKAKMFALDLAARMLGGRDADLRASARQVDSETSFLRWMDDAAACIEAAADPERARLFRERVAAAAAD